MDVHRKICLLGSALAFGTGVVGAQPEGGGGRGFGGMGGWGGEESSGTIVRGEGGILIDESTVRTARETASHSTGTPEWTNPPGFEKDVFTFARVLFRTLPNRNDRWNYFGRLGWWVDYPDADLNFSYRLQTLTTLRTDPDARVLRLTDPTLADFPVIYMEHVENMHLSEPEVGILHRYLLNGGALFINDTWNDLSWQHFESEMNRVLPGRAWTELKADHPIFHCVFDLKGAMKTWQVPTIHFWNRDYDPNDPMSHLQRRDRGPGAEEMHVRAWFDDKGRIMIVAINNSDVSDGWEREGEDDAYFHTFSEKISYPLGINIVFYLMTH